MKQPTPRSPKVANRDPNIPKRFVIVTRLSHASHGDMSHDTQESGCRRRVAALGGVVVASLNDTKSGDRLDRQGLRHAIDLIQGGEADCLMTYRIDRLARSQTQQAVIVSEIRRAGGDYVSATEDLGSGPMADFLRSTFAFATEIELTKIRDRVNDSFDARFADRKRYKPAKRPPYGYARIGTGQDATYIENHGEATIVRRIFAEAAAGLSRRAIGNRLNADGVPTPTGKGQWGTTTVVTILSRATYWTGQHEVWRSRVKRGADGIPRREPRRPEERYHVPFPALIDPIVAERAREAAAHNKWKSARDDRSPTSGVLRYGLAVCGSCGRSLSLIAPKVGNERYACTHHRSDRPVCTAPVSISRSQLDLAVVKWVNEIAFDPQRAASGWIDVVEPPEIDAALLTQLADADKRVADITAQVATFACDLALVSSAAASSVAERLTNLNRAIAEATAKRDQLAADIARRAFPARTTEGWVTAETVIAQAVDDALRAGWDAYRHWIDGEWDPLIVVQRDCQSDTVSGDVPQQQDKAERNALDRVPLPNPDSFAGFHAWRAALSTLRVRVTVNQVEANAPRWVARMMLPGGAIEGVCATHSPI